MKPILLIIQLLFCISALGQTYNLKERCPNFQASSEVTKDTIGNPYELAHKYHGHYTLEYIDRIQKSDIQNVEISDQAELRTEVLLMSDGTRIGTKIPNYNTKEPENIMFPLSLMINDTIYGHHNTLKGEGGLKYIKLINCNNILVNNKNKEYNKLGLDIEGIDDLYIVFYENKIIIRKREQ